MTEYLVLERANEEGEWTEVRVDPVEATNDVQAIKAVTAERSDKAGVFVAVPVRSFRPRTRTVETKEIDRWA